MKRAMLEQKLRIAGYHNDVRSYVRLRCGNRIALAKANEFYRQGAKAKEAGIGCACFECAGGAQ